MRWLAVISAVAACAVSWTARGPHISSSSLETCRGYVAARVAPVYRRGFRVIVLAGWPRSSGLSRCVVGVVSAVSGVGGCFLTDVDEQQRMVGVPRPVLCAEPFTTRKEQ